MSNSKLTIEIWSDLVCPFCYIGHRQLTNALSKLPKDTSYQITWKGFLLNPNFNKLPGENLLLHLARTKGQTASWAQEAIQQVSEMAAREGLDFNLDKAIPANSTQAHYLLLYANEIGKGQLVSELLFEAYFSRGLDIDLEDNLIAIAAQVGINWQEVKKQQMRLSTQLDADIQEARVLGVQGVPFMVINRKWGISGARGSEVMLKALLQDISENS